MRSVRNALPFVDDSEGGSKGTAENKGVVSDGSSAIARISRGYEGLPESVGEYSLEMNSRISVRWTKDGSSVECSRTGDSWRTEVHKDDKAFVVSEHGSLENAVEAAERLMSEDHEEDQAREGILAPGFEEEVESILEEVDKGSVSDIGEVFGD